MNLDRALMAFMAGGVAILYTAITFAFFEGTDPENRILYLAAIGVPLAIGFFAAPRLALYALGVLVYSVDWLAEYWQLIPREATWLVDLLIVLFALRYGFTFFSAKHKIFGVEKMILILLVFAVLSSLMNGEKMSTTLIGLRVGFRYLLLFLAAAGLHPKADTASKFIRFLFIVGMIQTPVILWQWRFTSWVSEDDLNGTFGRNQTPGIALFMMTLYAYIIAKMIEERQIRPAHLFVMAWMLICPIMGEAKFFFLLLPVFILFMIRAEFIRRPAIAIVLSLMGAVMFVAVDYIVVESGHWREGRNPLTYITKLPEVFEIEMSRPQEERKERSYRIVSAFVLASEDPRSFWFGHGPGSITLSYVSGEHTRTSEYFASYGLTSSAPSIAWLLIEYGYFGTVLVFLLLFMIYRRGRILRRSSNAEHRIYGRMLEGMTFLYVAWLFYQSAWQSDSMNFIYWPLAGIFVRLSYVTQEDPEYSAAIARAKGLRGNIRPALARPAT